MNVDDAILAHARWKTRLAAYLKTPDGSINVTELGADNRCELGKWIYSEAAHRLPAGELMALKTAHAKFHRIAAKVVSDIDTGKADPNALLGLGSDFGLASTAVVNILKSLKLG